MEHGNKNALNRHFRELSHPTNRLFKLTKKIHMFFVNKVFQFLTPEHIVLLSRKIHLLSSLDNWHSLFGIWLVDLTTYLLEF